MNVVLDISRFISRAHLSFDTGIDRVERAAIYDAIDRFENPHFVGRTGKKFVFLNKTKMIAFLEMESENNWPNASGSDRLRLKLSLQQRCVRTGLRNIGANAFSIGEFDTHFALETLKPFTYLNLGHANLGNPFLTAMRRAGASKIVTFIHDVIPLDFPEYCRADKVKSFENSFYNVIQHSDQVFCNSNYTATRIITYLKGSEKKPNINPIQLVSPAIDTSQISPIKLNGRPTFVMLGTIEPRKNLSFLLDIWDDLELFKMPDEMPNLLIIGKRGWESSATLSRLEDAIAAGFVFERNDLSDEMVRAHLLASHGLLFPSHVEGYGLPAQEALAMGVPVLASDIPVFDELFKDRASLLAANDLDVWIKEIETKMKSLDRKKISAPINSSWVSFFDSIYLNSPAE